MSGVDDEPAAPEDPARACGHNARAAQRLDLASPGSASSGDPADRRVRLGLVGSSGGHLAQLMALRPFWADYDRFWVTFATEDARSLLAGERVYWCHYPTNRNLKNLIRNTGLAVRVVRKEGPTHLISTGAAVAVPFFYVGRLAGAKLVFIETIDRMETATLTGRLVQPITQHMLVQGPEQLALYRRAELIGPLL
jgi:beta-1,4-N-acetylglucosaminyltransferase